MNLSEWLIALGNLCAGQMPAIDAQTKLRAYAPMLQSRYEAAAFCPRSLEAVASQSKFWPSYGELCDRLDAWWAANKPAQLAIAHPRALTPQQAAHVACCDRRLSDGGDPAIVLGVLHAASGKSAIAEILRDRPGLVSLCRAKGWLDDAVPLTAEQRQHVLEVAQAFSAGVKSRHAVPKSDIRAKGLVPDREPVRMNKLAVARAATPAVLKSRPDLQQILRDAESMGSGDR